ncbi:MAG: dTMP kinase [Propionibacteriaceae bacterium]|nr:dTMP kinase [Propionibacteriaceae bacterium]
MTPPARPHKGWFVVFEGGDGVGKSTQVQLAARALHEAGVEHIVTREPGDTRLGEALRTLLLDPATGDVAPRAEALLYAADKAQHLHQVVRPALERGAVVLCDRYMDSMLAYQGAGRVLDVDDIAAIGAWATGGLIPDLTVLLDMDPARAVGVKRGRDRLEQAGNGFHQRVRQGFLDLAAKAPERYLVLPARTGREHLAEQVRRRLVDLGIEALRR